jgi:hypothetical protein
VGFQPGQSMAYGARRSVRGQVGAVQQATQHVSSLEGGVVVRASGLLGRAVMTRSVITVVVSASSATGSHDRLLLAAAGRSKKVQQPLRPASA